MISLHKYLCKRTYTTYGAYHCQLSSHEQNVMCVNFWYQLGIILPLTERYCCQKALLRLCLQKHFHKKEIISPHNHLLLRYDWHTVTAN